MSSLSHTLYSLFHILFPSLSFSLSPTLFLSHRYSVATVFSVGLRLRWSFPMRPVRYRARYKRAVRHCWRTGRFSGLWCEQPEQYASTRAAL